MSYGKDERDIDKHVWKLPIPTYDPTDETHREIARLSGELAAEIASQTPRTTNFVTTRRDLRTYLAASVFGRKLNSLVIQLLGGDTKVELVDAQTQSQPGGENPGSWLIRTTSDKLGQLVADVEIDVDCEFDQTGKVYLWGALLSRVGVPDATYHSFGSAASDLDEHAVAAEFLSWLSVLLEESAASGLSARWFHYGDVDRRHLRRILGPSAESALASATDLLTEVIRPNFYAPAGYGLKQLAPGAGAAWRTAGANGADTISWIAAAHCGDQAAWARLVEYNEDDTRASKALRHRLDDDLEP